MAKCGVCAGRSWRVVVYDVLGEVVKFYLVSYRVIVLLDCGVLKLLECEIKRLVMRISVVII